MIVWLIITVVLLIWNAVYCGIKIVADFGGPKPASGVWGLFALARAFDASCCAGRYRCCCLRDLAEAGTSTVFQTWAFPLLDPNEKALAVSLAVSNREGETLCL